jgi:hypothetical protein
MATVNRLINGIDLSEVATSAENSAQVYIHSGGTYVVNGGRIFIGTEDPEDDGYTPLAGDIWYDTT